MHISQIMSKRHNLWKINCKSGNKKETMSDLNLVVMAMPVLNHMFLVGSIPENILVTRGIWVNQEMVPLSRRLQDSLRQPPKPE